MGQERGHGPRHTNTRSFTIPCLELQEETAISDSALGAEAPQKAQLLRRTALNWGSPRLLFRPCAWGKEIICLGVLGSAASLCWKARLNSDLKPGFVEPLSRGEYD
eukprot:13394826-Alexandrium_andersonii.AAC.2